MLSYKVFMSFVREECNAKEMISEDCYKLWVKTRKGGLKQPEESFRRVLTAHVCGLDGRKPFPEDVEKSLLVELRKKEIWPCFKNQGSSIGIRGFRNLGFHEANQGAENIEGKQIEQVQQLNKKRKYSSTTVNSNVETDAEHDVSSTAGSEPSSGSSISSNVSISSATEHMTNASKRPRLEVDVELDSAIGSGPTPTQNLLSPSLLQLTMANALLGLSNSQTIPSVLPTISPNQPVNQLNLQKLLNYNELQILIQIQLQLQLQMIQQNNMTQQVGLEQLQNMNFKV